MAHTLSHRHFSKETSANHSAGSFTALFHPVTGRKQIDAERLSLQQPLFGLTFDVQSAVRYTIEGKGRH